MKIGRNSPCPCGSRKKYKRCCLNKDDQHRLDKRANREELFRKKALGNNLYFPEEDFIHLDDLNGEIEYCSSYEIDGHGDILSEVIKLYRENTSKESYPVWDSFDDELLDDESSNKNRNEPNPAVKCSFNEDDFLKTISPDEQALIDEWWEENKNINGPLDEIEHIRSFLERYPHLDANMYLHDEVIFDIQNKLEPNENYHIFIDFLLYYRNKHPDAYALSFSFYDMYLITYFLTEGKSNEEIIPFFSFFKKYPIKFADQFMELVSMVISFSREELLPYLYQDTYISLDRADGLFDHYLIIKPYMFYQWSPYVKQLINSPEDKLKIFDGLHKNHVAFNSKLENARVYTGRQRLDCTMQEYFDDLPKCNFPHPFNYIEVKKFYFTITNHFIGYQVKELSLPWIWSNETASNILSFLLYPLRNDMIPRRPFRFNEELIENFTVKTFNNFFSVKTHETVLFLIGLCDFCKYLNKENLISVSEFEQLYKIASITLDNFCKKSKDYSMKYYQTISYDKQKIPDTSKVLME